MAFKKSKPSPLSSRFAFFLDRSHLAKARPEKGLTRVRHQNGGRNNTGRITVRHHGGGHKRLLREINFCRENKLGLPARVASLEFDPNRNAEIALLVYADGQKDYILAPLDLKAGDRLVVGPEADLKPGNALPLANIPAGLMVHNVELRPGKGGQLARGAGTGLVVLSKEDHWAIVKLPSGEKRKIPLDCYATIGQVGNVAFKLRQLGKAGRKRHLGWRPTVRGTCQDPDSHPHGGGEGRSSIGMPCPKTPWGKLARGNTRKKKKYSNKLIIERKK